MKLPLDGAGHVPLALALALALQLGSAVWWVSAKDRDTFFLERRVSNLEAGFSKNAEAQGLVLERLARIEERLGAEADLLNRIDKRFAPSAN